MRRRYVPLLRSKAGEAVALRDLDQAATDRIFPVIHLPEKPTSRFASKFADAWRNRPIALDGRFHFDTVGGAGTFSSLFAALGAAGVPVIPSIPLSAPGGYVQAARSMIGRYGPGLVVKAAPEEVGALAARTADHGWRPEDIDLVVDAGEITPGSVAGVADYLRYVLTQKLPHPDRWRSIALASAAAPRDLSALPFGRSELRRSDWHLWSAVAEAVPFALDYGDYAHANPDLTEPPGPAMGRATVSVKYAIDDAWVVLKGRPTAGPSGRKMELQYRGHATKLLDEPAFGGLRGCVADQHIRAIANGTTNAGSRVTWAGIMVNRHLWLVADRLP